MTVSAEVILASASPHARPLHTVACVYPWFIHGEVMTHRVFSRNASSNRAIPLRKMIDEATGENRAEPVYWGSERKGMQVGEEVLSVNKARNAWERAAVLAADSAYYLKQLGVHKSLSNRLLMPFTHARVLISSTEWSNFFALRLHEAAEPTMRALAVEIKRAIDGAEPQPLAPGQWHLPYVRAEIEDDGSQSYRVHLDPEGHGWEYVDLETAKRVSVARCARVSYRSLEDPEKVTTLKEDLALCERLIGSVPMHASPAEHQATPDFLINRSRQDDPWPGDYANRNQHGNFVGWVQHRKMLPRESAS